MTCRLYGRLGMINKYNRLPLPEARMYRNILMGQYSGGGEMHIPNHCDKRCFSTTFSVPSQTTRFTVSSVPSTPLQQSSGDAASLDRLAACKEINLVQKECNVEESGTKKRREYKYEIKDKVGDKLFDAVHMYEIFPPSFDFKLYGPSGSLLITHKLLQNLSSHLLSMQIIRPGGMYIGSIEEKINLNVDTPSVFELKDSRDEVQALVLTDFANTKFGFRRTIKILAPDQSTTIGKISKKWGGFNDKLVVSIHLPTPTHMNVQFRASLIGLCMLLSQRYAR